MGVQNPFCFGGLFKRAFLIIDCQTLPYPPLQLSAGKLFFTDIRLRYIKFYGFQHNLNISLVERYLIFLGQFIIKYIIVFLLSPFNIFKKKCMA
jgi:hypothetical protein